jgi:hypothetical protein
MDYTKDWSKEKKKEEWGKYYKKVDIYNSIMAVLVVILLVIIVLGATNIIPDWYISIPVIVCVIWGFQYPSDPIKQTRNNILR